MGKQRGPLARGSPAVWIDLEIWRVQFKFKLAHYDAVPRNEFEGFYNQQKSNALVWKFVFPDYGLGLSERVRFRVVRGVKNREERPLFKTNAPSFAQLGPNSRKGRGSGKVPELLLLSKARGHVLQLLSQNVSSDSPRKN